MLEIFIKAASTYAQIILIIVLVCANVTAILTALDPSELLFRHPISYFNIFQIIYSSQNKNENIYLSKV